MENTNENQNITDIYFSLSQGERTKVRKRCVVIGKWSNNYLKLFVSKLKANKSLTGNELQILESAINTVNNRVLKVEVKEENDLCSKEDVTELRNIYRKFAMAKRMELREILAKEIDNIDYYMEQVRLKKPIPNEIYKIISQNIAKL